MSEVEEREIDKRNAGCGAFIGHRLYIWGGETEVPVESSSSESSGSDSESDDDDEELLLTTTKILPRHDGHPFDVFDVISHSWSRQKTTGLEEDSIPSVGNGSTLTYHLGTNALYLYGGWNEKKFSSDVYKVCAATWEWEKVKLSTPLQPSPRYLTAVLLHGDKICNFAGVGPPIIEGQDKGASYITYEARGIVHSFGWNNEYYEFDINSSSWEAPISGKNANRPPPCGGLIMTKFDPTRAVYFGGRREPGYTNETFIFDLEIKEFRGPLKVLPIPGQSTPRLPVPRSFPTLTSLLDPDLVGKPLCGYGPVVKPKLLLMWGKRTEKIITEEVWLLDPLSGIWSQVDMGNLEPRSWHIAQPYYCHPHSTECRVVIFGGNVHIHRVPEISGDRVNTADLKILRFGVPSLRNISISAAITGLEDLSVYAHSTVPHAIWQQVGTAFEAQRKHTFVTPQVLDPKRNCNS